MEDRTDPASLALTELFRGLEVRIRAAAGRFSLDESDVQEVLQDVRIRIWKARGEGGGIGGTPAGYVYRVALTAALDLIRRRRRRRSEVLPLSLPAPEAERPDHLLESAQLGAAVSRALDGLSERRRPVVRMYLAGYGSGEIAELMGWSEAKARNLLYRGLGDLREGLVALGVGPAPMARGGRKEAIATSSGLEVPTAHPAPRRDGGNDE